MPRPYRLGRRQASVDATGRAILGAARELISESGPAVSVGAVARRAGVSRLTVYNRFGSRERLLRALTPERVAAGDEESDPRQALRRRLQDACARWAADPGLFRNLPALAETERDADRGLAGRLAAADALRPGCSLREAEDVLGALASFPVFDRLHHDGRRSPAAVAEILTRLAGAVLA